MSDYIIHRFRRIDKNLLQSLVNSELCFSRPDRLNDPFDCRVSIFDSLDRAIHSVIDAKRDGLNRLREFMNDSVNISEIESFSNNVGVYRLQRSVANGGHFR